MEKLDIKLDAFEGPLDLLLHLIEKNKFNIFDIPIVEILMATSFQSPKHSDGLTIKAEKT